MSGIQIIVMMIIVCNIHFGTDVILRGHSQILNKKHLTTKKILSFVTLRKQRK